MSLGRVVRGALSGAVATAAMSAVMLAARRRGAVDELAPKVITDSIVPDEASISEPAAAAVATTAHFGYGIANGVVFAVVAPRLPGPRAARGVAYALTIMLVSYEGWVPAAGILPRQHRQPTGRASTLLAGHLVYGAVLGALAA